MSRTRPESALGAPMRTYLGFPRAVHTPSPRILFYASDLPELALRDLALAGGLVEEFMTGCVVLASGAAEVTREPSPARIEVVKVPSLTRHDATRPLARQRVSRLRQRLLCTLFDMFRPDLLLLDMVGPQAELEARLLLQRARALGTATRVGISHEQPGQPCFAPESAESTVCESCRKRTCTSAREALEKRAQGRLMA